MSDRKIFDLSKDDDGWLLKERGASRARRRFDTKAEALQESPKIVRNSAEESQLVIRKQNGRIQEERTYPRSSDPRHRKG